MKKRSSYTALTLHHYKKKPTQDWDRTTDLTTTTLGAYPSDHTQHMGVVGSILCNHSF